MKLADSAPCPPALTTPARLPPWQEIPSAKGLGLLGAAVGETGHPLMVGASVVFVLVAAWLVTEGQRNTGSSLAALSLAQAEELRLLSLKRKPNLRPNALIKPSLMMATSPSWERPSRPNKII